MKHSPQLFGVLLSTLPHLQVSGFIHTRPAQSEKPHGSQDQSLLSVEPSLPFQEDMPNIRKRMMYEILTRQLLTTGTRLGEG